MKTEKSISIQCLIKQVFKDIIKKYRGESVNTLIDNKKIDRIVMSSKIYLSKNKWKNSVRYDIIGITKNKINEKMVINWIKNAF